MWDEEMERGWMLGTTHIGTRTWRGVDRQMAAAWGGQVEGSWQGAMPSWHGGGQAASMGIVDRQEGE